MSTPASHFFMSYSREDTSLQQRVIAGLRQRGVKVWVDVENLIPGSPAWEREIERAIRDALGIVVLLSPDANNSEWVRREISFAEQTTSESSRSWSAATRTTRSRCGSPATSAWTCAVTSRQGWMNLPAL